MSGNKNIIILSKQYDQRDISYNKTLFKLNMTTN